jgi:hypothetical protein
MPPFPCRAGSVTVNDRTRPRLLSCPVSTARGTPDGDGEQYIRPGFPCHHRAASCLAEGLHPAGARRERDESCLPCICLDGFLCDSRMDARLARSARGGAFQLCAARRALCGERVLSLRKGPVTKGGVPGCRVRFPRALKRTPHDPSPGGPRGYGGKTGGDILVGANIRRL